MAFHRFWMGLRLAACDSLLSLADDALVEGVRCEVVLAGAVCELFFAGRRFGPVEPSLTRAHCVHELVALVRRGYSRGAGGGGGRRNSGHLKGLLLQWSGVRRGRVAMGRRVGLLGSAFQWRVLLVHGLGTRWAWFG